MPYSIPITIEAVGEPIPKFYLSARVQVPTPAHVTNTSNITVLDSGSNPLPFYLVSYNGTSGVIDFVVKTPLGTSTTALTVQYS